MNRGHFLRLGAAMLAGLGIAMPGAALAQSSTPSTGVFKTAQQVFDLCTSTEDDEIENCDFFIMASHDMMKFYGDTDMGGTKICVPMGSKELDIRNAVIAYWRANPEARKFSAVSTIYNALTQKFPCS